MLPFSVEPIFEILSVFLPAALKKSYARRAIDANISSTRPLNSAGVMLVTLLPTSPVEFLRFLPSLSNHPSIVNHNLIPRHAIPPKRGAQAPLSGPGTGATRLAHSSSSSGTSSPMHFRFHDGVLSLLSEAISQIAIGLWNLQ